MRALVWGQDYFVRYVSLPPHTGAVTVVNGDGTYDIYINADHPVEIQWKSFLHELVHCEAGHFDERKDISEKQKEWEADNLMPLIVGDLP